MKFLVHTSYTDEGFKGLLKEGASKRREAVEQATKSIGGKLEGIYWAMGENDVIFIVDVPDATNLLALGQTARATGAISGGTKITVLFTAEEVDKVIKMTPSYRPPGK
ncbi:MAG TPA: GYD domain-containing protein [Nitrososphaerales archaeon]|nr:GYD domain-containing protein [Nitrososphaerales archaeon]